MPLEATQAQWNLECESRVSVTNDSPAVSPANLWRIKSADHLGAAAGLPRLRCRGRGVIAIS